MGDTSLTIADCPQEDTDFPSNVIVVRARSPDSKEVTNFLSGERAPDPSNFQVTNFLNSRDAEMTKTPRIGIDNHSFEEEDNNTRSDSRNSGTCTPIGMSHFFTVIVVIITIITIIIVIIINIIIMFFQTSFLVIYTNIQWQTSLNG